MTSPVGTSDAVTAHDSTLSCTFKTASMRSTYSRAASKLANEKIHKLVSSSKRLTKSKSSASIASGYITPAQNETPPSRKQKTTRVTPKTTATNQSKTITDDGDKSFTSTFAIKQERKFAVPEIPSGRLPTYSQILDMETIHVKKGLRAKSIEPKINYTAAYQEEIALIHGHLDLMESRVNAVERKVKEAIQNIPEQIFANIRNEVQALAPNNGSQFGQAFAPLAFLEHCRNNVSVYEKNAETPEFVPNSPFNRLRSRMQRGDFKAQIGRQNFTGLGLIGTFAANLKKQEDESTVSVNPNDKTFAYQLASDSDETVDLNALPQLYQQRECAKPIGFYRVVKPEVQNSEPCNDDELDFESKVALWKERCGDDK